MKGKLIQVKSAKKNPQRVEGKLIQVERRRSQSKKDGPTCGKSGIPRGAKDKWNKSG